MHPVLGRCCICPAAIQPLGPEARASYPITRLADAPKMPYVRAGFYHAYDFVKYRRLILAPGIGPHGSAELGN